MLLEQARAVRLLVLLHRILRNATMVALGTDSVREARACATQIGEEQTVVHRSRSRKLFDLNTLSTYCAPGMVYFSCLLFMSIILL